MAHSIIEKWLKVSDLSYDIRNVMLNVKPHQRVNKLPGSGYVTNKVNLATTSLEHIPPAFR